MISLLLIAYLFYQVIVLKKRFFLLYYLILSFSIYSLPSSIKYYFVLQIAGSLVYPQDLMLIIVAMVLLTDSTIVRHLKKNRPIFFTVILLVTVNLLQVLWAYKIYGMQSYFLRIGLSGAFMYLFSLTAMDVLDNPKEIKNFGRVLIGFNLITLLSAGLVTYFPWLNSYESRLYSHIGWAVQSGKGSQVFVNVISGDICLFTIYYFLLIEKRKLLSPIVILPILLIVLTSHRITYVALIVLLFYTLIWKKKNRKPRFTVKSVAAMHGAIFIILVITFILSGNDRIVANAKSFYGRALSLGDAKNVTIIDRQYQYKYFFKSYLTSHNLSTYLFGETYKPHNFRDSFFGRIVTPHNFIIHTIVMRGFIGLFLICVLSWAVIKKYNTQRGSPFFAILIIFMLTQMTDAAFTNYPFSAFFAILLALIISNSGNKWEKRSHDYSA